MLVSSLKKVLGLKMNLIMKPFGKSLFPGLESDSKPSEAVQAVFLGTSSMDWLMVSSLQSVRDSNTA